MVVPSGIMVYLAFASRKYAVASDHRQPHVIIILVSRFFQWEFSLAVLAAVLAVLGYSVNESVVIFDRSGRTSGVTERW
jgi:preprotein translocase subunit SecF